MPSQAELDAQNNASRARQQARRGIQQPAPQRQQPQVQQPYVNPYGGQYGTDSIQDQSYYDNYYNDSYYDDSYVNPYGGQYGTDSIQDQDYYDNYYDDEGMTDEEWSAYLAGLEEGQGSQEEPSYYSDYGSRMPDGPIEASYPEEIQVIPRGGLRTRGTGGNQSQIALDRTGGAGGTQDPGIYETFMNTILPSEEQKSANLAAGSRTSGIQVLPEPEAETPFLQYLQENTEQPQGGGSNQMEQGSAGSPQSNYYDFVQGGGQMNDEQLRQANEMAMSMGTTFDPETGYSRQPYLDYQEQGPQVQAPMSISDTRGMLQERFGSPTVYDQPDRSFYDEESMRRDQRQAARPDFGKSYKSIEDDRITRDIDKYDDRRTFAEARRLVPTQRDKYGNITNQAQQRAAMTLTEKEVQDKKRDEYNKEYRAKNLERIQQTIDNGNKPNASKLEKKKGEVAEEILLVQETYANYQPWMGQAIEADRMNIVPAPSGFKSHLDFAAYQNNFNIDELYETMNQENNKEGGAAPVKQTQPAATGSAAGGYDERTNLAIQRFADDNKLSLEEAIKKLKSSGKIK